MELIDYLRMLRRQWLWVVGSVVVLTALAAAYAFMAPKSYRATSDIYVLGTVVGDPQNQNDAAQSASKYVFDNIDTFAALVDSPKVTGPVIKDLKLTSTPEQLAKQVSANVVPNTVIITVAAIDASPDTAAAIANSTATSLTQAIKSLAIPGSSAPLDISTVKPATPPTSPDSPNRTLWLALGVLLGLALGLVIATLREQVRRTPKAAAAVTADELAASEEDDVVAADHDDDHVDVEAALASVSVRAESADVRTPATSNGTSSSSPIERAESASSARRPEDQRAGSQKVAAATDKDVTAGTDGDAAATNGGGSKGAPSATPTDPEAAPRDPAPTRR